MREPKRLIEKIKSVMSPNLRYPAWKTVRPISDDPFTGLCYTASEALYHLWGKDNGFVPYSIEVHVCVPGRGEALVSHWYLSNGRVVIDATASQFPDPVDYRYGERCGFMTRTPSKRTREVMRR